MLCIGRRLPFQLKHIGKRVKSALRFVRRMLGFCYDSVIFDRHNRKNGLFRGSKRGIENQPRIYRNAEK